MNKYTFDLEFVIRLACVFVIIVLFIIGFAVAMIIYSPVWFLIYFLHTLSESIKATL